MPHALQGALDALPEYLADAQRLYGIVEQRNERMSTDRRAAGGRTGGGQPPVANKSLNRAVVVASVGALEAFFEDLALRAVPLDSRASVPKQWFPIIGSRGAVQTPNSENLAKLLWVYFRYDPRPAWDLSVTAAWSEVGTGTGWRGAVKNYQGAHAAAALDAMVKVRHGFAHQDKTNTPPAKPGLVSLSPTGKLSLQSHHAFNSLCVVVQIAVQTTEGLATHLGATNPAFRWKTAMTKADWHRLLSGSATAASVAARWTGPHPF